MGVFEGGLSDMEYVEEEMEEIEVGFVVDDDINRYE